MKNILLVASGSVAVKKTKILKDLLSFDFNIKVIATDYVRNNFNAVQELDAEIEKKNLNTFPLHIEHAKWADLIVVAPASANTLAKFVNGISDNQVLSTLIAARTKILFAPAMNTYMYKALEERKVFEKITNMGHMLIGPNVGKLWEGEFGLGRMSEPFEIKDSVLNYFKHTGKAIVIGGASKVYLDPIRYITNKSSGLMAKILANELRINGIHVEYIDVSKYTNETLIKMLDKKLDGINFLFSVAALADFTTEKANNKIKKGSINKILVHDAPDVLSALVRKHKDVNFVAFKLDDKIKNAKIKMKNLDLTGILWNKVDTIGSNTSTGSFLCHNKQINFENLSKLQVARLIIKEVI